MTQTQFTSTNVVDVHTTADVANDPTVQRIASDGVGGFTITSAIGGWVDPKTHRLVTEPAAVIRLMSDDIGAITRTVRAIANVAFVDYDEAELWAVTVARDADLQIVRPDSDPELDPALKMSIVR